MRQWRALIGASLMVAAVSGMVLWEGWGRDALLLADVVAVDKNISAGQLLKEEDLVILGVPQDCITSDAVPASDMKSLVGMYAVNSLSPNQQVCRKDVVSEEELVKDQKTTFVIPREWIAMRSSSLRRGDTVTLYRLSDYSSMGTYTVAFVKDDEDQEVYSLEGVEDGKLLDRTDSNMPVDHIEIVAELAQYGRIRQAVAEDGGLLVVQGKGENS